MLSPARLLTLVSCTLTAYRALLAVPEPVLSKGMAAAFSLLLWGYLGWEFFDLIRAYVQLADEAGHATTFTELHEAGERFGKVIGPSSVRILVLVGTAALGETAALVSKPPRLPGFRAASQRVEAQTGLQLAEAVLEAERVVISMPTGRISVVVPSHAMTMAAMGGKLRFHGHRAWQSHRGMTKALGSAGKDKTWHHVVEQTPGNVERFGPEAIHNTSNVVPLDANVHKAISRFYSSKSEEAGGMVVREWLRVQSYEQQRAFGLRVLKQFGVTP